MLLRLLRWLNRKLLRANQRLEARKRRKRERLHELLGDIGCLDE